MASPPEAMVPPWPQAQSHLADNQHLTVDNRVNYNIIKGPVRDSCLLNTFSVQRSAKVASVCNSWLSWLFFNPF